MREEYLSRIADSLEKLVPTIAAEPEWYEAPAYVWEGNRARAVSKIEAPELDLLQGIDTQKAIIVENVMRHAKGYAAHDMLLWGARGTGKSVLLRASVKAAQALGDNSIALVQIAPDALTNLPSLFSLLGKAKRRFLVFIDDLGFEAGDNSGPRILRSWLEGGIEARPNNVRLAVTSNRRAIVIRNIAEQDDPINPRDAIDDSLALADRFGLSVGFHNCNQDDYLTIIRGYAEFYGMDWLEPDALEWSKRRGARSGRIAWQFVTELAGRAGIAL